MSDDEYPVRARIVDAEAEPGFLPHGLRPRTPEESRPHIGKEGLAELQEDGSVEVALDDGTVLLGSECWWEPCS